MLKRLFHSASIIQGTYCKYSTVMSNEVIKSLDFYQLKSELSKDNVYLIDVREKKELIEDGELPHTVHIPLGEIESALQLLAEEYKVKYNCRKPDFDTYIAFSCRAGGRSLKAANIAVQLGYRNVANYTGGYSDWAKKTAEEKS